MVDRKYIIGIQNSKFTAEMNTWVCILHSHDNNFLSKTVRKLNWNAVCAMFNKTEDITTLNVKIDWEKYIDCVINAIGDAYVTWRGETAKNRSVLEGWHIYKPFSCTQCPCIYSIFWSERYYGVRCSII